MVDRLRPDVAVVGASPAGLAAARTAAEGGADTILLEARREIGVPESPAKVAFQHLWDTQWTPPDHTIEQRTSEVMLHSPSGHRLAVEAPAWVLDRSTFDQHLCSQARKAGASIRAGLGELDAPAPTRLEAADAELRVEPRVTLFADGAESLAGAFLDATRHPDALAWGAWDALDPGSSPAADRIHITVGRHAPGGRTQLTPLGDGSWAHWTFVQGSREDLADHAAEALAHTLDTLVWPERLQRTARRIAVGPDPVFRVPHRLAGDRFAVVGGAAAQGGLEIGLASGELAGQQAARAATGATLEPTALSGYAESWRERYQAGYESLARWNRWLAMLDDEHLDQLLAPWDGRTVPVEHLHPLGRGGVHGPLKGLSMLAREAPVAVLATGAAALPAIGRLLGAGDLSPGPPARRPAPR